MAVRYLLGPNQNFATFGLRTDLGGLHIGAHEAGHGGNGGGGGGSFALGERLAGFRGSGNAVIAHKFRLGIDCAGKDDCAFQG